MVFIACGDRVEDNVTTALWLFDEPLALYPSSSMDDQTDNDNILTLGPGGKIVEGKFGNALEPIEQPKVRIPKREELQGLPDDKPKGAELFGLAPESIPEGRTVEPMNWMNTNFAALMTLGENHLRKESGHKNPTDSNLNLGDFDWTVEFWYQATRNTGEVGVVFEIGAGPRGENDQVTSLLLNATNTGFIFKNQPTGIEVAIPSNAAALDPAVGEWHHLAFVYEMQQDQLKHYVDGVLQPLGDKAVFKILPHGDEAYMSIGRSGTWDNPLQGKMDELRFSSDDIYSTNFDVPGSLSPYHGTDRLADELVKGLPLLFADDKSSAPLQLGGRKHLFIDNAILAEQGDISFVVNPPKRAERVIDNIEGSFRKHLTVVEDEEGLIRIYNSTNKDYLQVHTSRDGIHFEKPNVGHGIIEGKTNIVLPENVGGLGNPFIDPNGPDYERWKYISGYNRRGIYVYTSPDGYTWNRNHTSLLPFRSGTQSCSFYDEQLQQYTTYHRSGIFHTPGDETMRSSVVVGVTDLFSPVEFDQLTQAEYQELDKSYPLREPLPWYLDNGPLTGGGFGMEFEHKFDPIPEDPIGVDFYITKAQKYEWAPDTYLAFPIAYFHYDGDGPATRAILGTEERGRGSGPLESQLEVSRNGLDWERFARPAYVGIGRHHGRNVVTAYIAQGMVRRGEEIWQYYFGETQYHSAHIKDSAGRGVYRLVQRLDGFVSADSPYEKEAIMVTKPFVFEGNRLQLNIDTDGMGYAQVGFIDESGSPIEGFSVDDCIYINGDFIAENVEWLNKGVDVGELAGQTVQLVFRMRGSKLFAMQFVNN
jgi:hypothetical protein|tara:strand:- start:125 stop:2572 length:2448 start_codon:yes stop_codon:yes gene_type:complete